MSQKVVCGSPMMQALFAEARAFATAPAAPPCSCMARPGPGKQCWPALCTGISPPGPFVPVHGEALAPELAKSRFFGHKKSSDTDAVRQHRGDFRQAHGGVMLLDQVESMLEPL
jgi:DNA-binding NtrC family response regulator